MCGSLSSASVSQVESTKAISSPPSGPSPPNPFPHHPHLSAFLIACRVLFRALAPRTRTPDKLERLSESAAKRAKGARRSRHIPPNVDTFFGTLVTMRCVSHCVCVHACVG